MEETKADFIQEKDILGQDKPSVKMKDRNFGKSSEKKIQIDHSGEYNLPSIKMRYFSVLIDLIAIVGFSLGISSLFETIGEVHDYVRASTFVIVILLYEPILISTGSTIGQWFLDIRVRKFNDPEKKLRFINALLRLILKTLLGWISFVTVTGNKNRRAIHDYAAGSIVIKPKQQD